MLTDPTRRQLLVTGSAALLAGCATTPKVAAPACAPLPPVRVDPGRVVRTLAGLRPYRESGFVVRREALGDKALVHNYGHGGAGITLSWGSSRLALDLGLPGHQGAVAVVGAGIMGLTTARLVQEAGFPVTIYARDLPQQTTSAVAGGQVSPFGHYREASVTAAWRQQFMTAMDYSFRRFQLMLGDDWGVRWQPTFEDTDDEVLAPHPLDPYFPGSRLLGPAAHPFPLERVVRFNAMYVETPRYLDRMLRHLLERGARIERRDLPDAQALAALPERLVFNCTGIGSRQLFGDMELHPVRGQVALIQPQLEVRYAASGHWGYMFARPDGIVLGGTFERDVWDTTPDPQAIARILERHRTFFAGFRCAA